MVWTLTRIRNRLRRAYAGVMDPLTDLLAGVRAEGAFTVRATMSAPWGIDVRDEAPLTVVTVVRGTARLDRAGDAADLTEGDVLVVQGPLPYLVGDAQGSPAGIVVLPDQRCVDLAGRPVHQSMAHGLRTWGNEPDGADVLLIGTYAGLGEVGSLLAAALPAWFVVSADELAATAGGAAGSVTELMAAQLERDVPGQGVLLDRLLDVLLVEAVRAHAAAGGVANPAAGPFAASDPTVRLALELLHAEPARGWTLPTLARASGTSRATLSRRFAAQVGEPPMTYLTHLRLALAADLLGDPAATVASAARAVGYATPFALSTAFTRRYGVSPSAYRGRAG